jgi:hypothetical protein
VDCHCYTETVDVGNVTFTTTTHPKLYLKALQVTDTEDAARQVQLVDFVLVYIHVIFSAKQCNILQRGVAHCAHSSQLLVYAW